MSDIAEYDEHHFIPEYCDWCGGTEDIEYKGYYALCGGCRVTQYGGLVAEYAKEI